jgi:hypothetical protein
MATEAEAFREAKAKVIDAEGEQKASLALKQAADTINKRQYIKILIYFFLLFLI